MKKIFFAVLMAMLLTIGSVAAAQPNYNFVRVSDLGAQAFVDRMGNSRTYQNLLQNGTLVAFTAPERHADLDDPQNFPGLSVYRSLFGIKGAHAPNGQLRFYVDPQGYVFVVQLINDNAPEPQLAGMVLIMTLEALGLNEQEGNILLQAQSLTAETWCAATGRKILRVVTDQAGNNIFLFGATN